MFINNIYKCIKIKLMHLTLCSDSNKNLVLNTYRKIDI